MQGRSCQPGRAVFSAATQTHRVKSKVEDGGDHGLWKVGDVAEDELQQLDALVLDQLGHERGHAGVRHRVGQEEARNHILRPEPGHTAPATRAFRTWREEMRTHTTTYAVSLRTRPSTCLAKW